MFAPGLPPALRRAVCLAQSFSRCRVARDTWRSGQRRACSGKPGAPGGGDDGARRTGSVPGNASPGKSTKLNAAQRPAVQRALVDGPDARARPARSVDDDTLDGVNKRPGKDRKLLFVSAKIAQHDLQTKTKNVVKLVSKGHEVKITIFEGGADVNKVQRAIEDAVRNSGSVQRMPSKKNSILLLITPLHKQEGDSVDSKEKTDGSLIIERDNT